MKWNQEKMIEIAHYKNDYAYACIENSVITIIKWFGSDYELMYSRCWSFEYLDQKEIPFGKRIFDGDTNQPELLEKYHGIRTKLLRPGHEEAITITMNELNQGIPVVIGIDSFWLNWITEFYQKKHDLIGHAIIIRGYDPIQKNLYCLDPLHPDYQILPLSDFIEGYNNLLIQFDRVTVHNPIDYNLILKESLSTMFQKNNNRNIFDKIRLFASHVLTDFEPEKEAAGYPSEVETDLLMRTKRISQKRLRFAEILEYIQKHEASLKLDYFMDKIKEAAFKWDIIYSMFLKSFFVKDKTTILNKIYQKLILIAENEENLALQLQDRIHSGKEYQIKQEDLPSSGCSNYQTLDLESYYNNHGMSEDVQSDARLSLFRSKIFLLREQLLLQEEIQFEGIPFRIASAKSKNPDNISCDQTIIQISPVPAKEIYFLGFSEYGHFKDEIILTFEDGQREQNGLGFTDWDSAPLFGEKIVWTGNGVKEGKIMDNKIHLFFQTLIVKTQKKLVSIQLPDCQSMHILSITLGNNITVTEKQWKKITQYSC